MTDVSLKEVENLLDGINDYMAAIGSYLVGEPSSKLAELSKTKQRYQEGEYGVIASLVDYRDRSPIDIPNACNQLIMGEINIDDISVQPAAIKITDLGNGKYTGVMPGLNKIEFRNGNLTEFAGRGDIIYNAIAFDWLWETYYLGKRTEVICLDLRYFLAVLPKVGLGHLAKNLIKKMGERYSVEEAVLVSICSQIDAISLTLVD